MPAALSAEAKAMIGQDVAIVDSASAVAREVAAFLAERDLLRSAEPDRSGAIELLVTDLPKTFDATASRFLGAHVPGASLVDL